MKLLKKLLAFTVSCVMTLSCVTAVNISVVSAAPSISGGWYETLYAEWSDSNPDAAKVEYKSSTETNYTALSGQDAEFLIRPASTSGYGRVDIPGLKKGVYDIRITASDGVVHERKGINVIAHDRSGYAHWTEAGPETYQGVGAYNNDGTLKDNALVVYVTDQNKDTVEVPGYEGMSWHYTPSSGSPYDRTGEGIGNILNNNMKLVQQVTITDNHPIVIRLIGKVNVPKNLTPHDAKDPILGGSEGDNGNLAITKYARNITIEGIGTDAEVDGWGFTFSQTATCPTQAGESFEVRNLTFRNYPEDGLGFQGDDAITCPIRRVWVHNNVFYPGYCANPTESDKGDGDGSCDFKRGQYYTMSYNHYIKCHKTNLLGAGDSNDQFFMTLHHNWYESVASRQPLAAGGNVHIYNTYFQDKMTGGANKHDTSTVIDLRGKAAAFSENNYFEACKNCYTLRKSTSNLKVYNDKKVSITVGGKVAECTDGGISGTLTIAETRKQNGIPDNGLQMPDGGSIANWDTNPHYFYCDSAGNSVVEKLDAPDDVPTEVQTYAGTLHEFPQVEFGTVVITVTDEAGKPVTDASVTASGLSFMHQGNGIYEATASLYSEYNVTVSKEGYENVVVKTTPITVNGGSFEDTVTLKADTDGYAVVKLTGGSENKPVTGATVTLNNGDALKDQNDGTYKSDKQYPVNGTYTVTITNTGDYIAPTGAQPITIKTTDAATEIHLGKAQGAVSVTLVAAEGSTKTLDLTNAAVYAGSTQLTKTGDNVFTGTVDVGTPLTVTATVAGWQVVSIEPAQLTATTTGTASAVITLQEGGEEFIWDYTNGKGVDGEFFVFGGSKTWNDWGEAAKNSLENPDEPGSYLTKARKVESSRELSFNAPADGKLLIVAHDKGKGGTTIKLTEPDGTVSKIAVPQGGGQVTTDVKAGTNTLAKGDNESELFYLKYTVTGDYVAPPTPPAPGETTTTAQQETPSEGTTEAKTEATTSAPVNSSPVGTGAAESNDGGDNGGISVLYDAASDSYTLKDTTKNLAAKLNIPLTEPIANGKVVVSGTATPSKAAGTWALVSVTGPKITDNTGAEVYPEIAALYSDDNKYLTLRVNSDKTNGVTPSGSKIPVTPNKTYNYEFIIDLDTKSVTLSIDGTVFTNTIPFTETAVGGFASITAVNATDRNITVSNPYIGIVEDTPAPPEPGNGLTDEYIWPVDTDLVKDDTGMIELGVAFLANSEEDAAAQFTEGDQTYELWDWVQPNADPKDSRGQGPMSPEDLGNGGPTGIPVSGGYLKFTPIKDGALTLAVKINPGKPTYITDETGEVVRSVTKDTKSYDIIRINVKQGKSYNVFSNGSKICIYYIGYTPGKVVEEPSSESTTEGPTESTTAAGEESTQGPTESTTDSGSNPPEPGTEGTTAGPVEDTTTPEPGTEGSTEGTTTGPNTEGSTSPQPGTEGSTEGTTTGPNTEGSTSPQPGTEGSTEGTTTGPNTEGSTSPEPSTETTTESTTAGPEDYGDANGDRKVEITDVVAALQYVLKGVPFTNEFKYLDVDGSGKIDSEDVAMILQHVLDSSFNIDPTKK